MVVISVDMWPQGDQTKAHSLGKMTLTLKAVGVDGRRSYEWEITKFGGTGVWKKGSISGHDPKTRGPWDLIYRVLAQAVGARNPPAG